MQSKYKENIWSTEQLFPKRESPVNIQRDHMVVNRVSSSFSKRWPLSNPKRTKINVNTHKVKRHRNAETKTRKQSIMCHRSTALERSVKNYVCVGGGGGGLRLVLRTKPHPQFLKWYKTFSCLFGSHDNPLTRQ